ncbi:hypothetical protein WIS52_20425 [Pseudonocardia nematodicida]|uniref:Uncharacterized protein n=1 Tax=Pseudonocardia nematodicida TaxID=1206997 RepID=A0ABV1KEG0_9PSEU
MFCSPDVPAWDSIQRVVQFLRGDVEQFRQLWIGATGGGPSLVGEASGHAQTADTGTPTAPADPPSRVRGGRGNGPLDRHRPGHAHVVSRSQAAAEPLMAPRLPPSLANTLRRRVTRSLDQPLGSASYGDIGAQLDRFEQVLLALCVQAVLDVLGERAEPAGPGVHLLHVAGRVLALKLRPDLERERTLRTSLQDVASPDLTAPDLYVNHTCKINGSVGRFDQICLTLPRELEADMLDAVRAPLLVTLETGYAVLQRRAGAALVAMESSFDRALYGKLRGPLGALAGNDAWLLLVTRQRVCLPVDHDVVTRVLRRAHLTDDPVLAPVQRAYRIVAGSYPLTAAIRQALHARDTVRFQVADGQAFRSDDLIGRVFAPGTEVAVMPLAAAERISILIASPENATDRVAEMLGPARDALARLIDQY